MAADVVARNVLGGPLETCGKDPLTGFYRTGCCETGPDDLGVHVVCAVVTEEFLTFSKAQGNDLSTPRPGFDGLKPGDPWCVCVLRWIEAERHGVAPPIVLAATHETTLRVVSLETLMPYALDREMVP
jgi:uncharacterized protein (DUF2237 family)